MAMKRGERSKEMKGEVKLLLDLSNSLGRYDRQWTPPDWAGEHLCSTYLTVLSR
jgi:hypothetical protein